METIAVVLVAVLVYGFGVPCPTIPKVTEVTENETASYEQPEFP